MSHAFRVLTGLFNFQEDRSTSPGVFLTYKNASPVVQGYEHEPVFRRVLVYACIILIFLLKNQKTSKTEKTSSKTKKKTPKKQNKKTKQKQRKTLNNTVNVRGRCWATVKPQSCISSPKGNSAPLEEVTGGFRGRYAQPLP